MVRDDLVCLLGPKMRPGWQNDSRILVDPEDAWLLEYKWQISQRGSVAYVLRGVGRGYTYRNICLHRVILDAPPGMEVDHINHNGLDNRRCNLRLASPKQNKANMRPLRPNASGYKGVALHRRSGLWRARIKDDGKECSLGYFRSPEEAARAYDRAAKQLHGEFALTNEMLGLYPQQKAEATA